VAAFVSEQRQERPDPPPWTGPWADDARRLFQVLQVALEETGPESADPGHPPECAYCPLCRGIAALRRAGPDVLDRVSDLAAGMAATLRSLDDEPGAQPGSGTEADAAPGSASGSTSGPARPPSTVRIDVTD
jgi:hypothetical protein